MAGQTYPVNITGELTAPPGERGGNSVISELR